MEIQVLTTFHLKVTLIGEAVANKVTLTKIWPIFRPSLAQIVSRIAKFERISKFYDLTLPPTGGGQIGHPIICFKITFDRCTLSP